MPAPRPTRVIPIELPPPTFLTFKVRLVGTTPLLCSNFSEDAKRRLAASMDGSAKPKKTARHPEVDFEESIYRLADGSYGFPKLAFRKAMSVAAVRMTDLKGTNVLAAFSIESADDLLPLDVGEPRMRTDHVIHGMSADLAYRAEFWPWAVELPIKLDPEVISISQFIHVLSKAGMGVGVGNWRPEKKGDHGTWEVAAVTEAAEYVREVAAA